MILEVTPVDLESSLMGVLTYNENDNGRGKSRLTMLRHRHEIESGRTSSISRHILGFDALGQVINYGSNNTSSWEQICEQAAKIISLMDTCGHPKYQRTTIGGLAGSEPHYACLVLSANVGCVPDVSKEHFRLTLSLNVPVFIVITKIDVASPPQLTRTIQDLLRFLSSPGINKLPSVIQSQDDIVTAMPLLVNSSVVPIFLASSVTGDNIPLLTSFFNLLPKNSVNKDLVEAETIYHVDDVYDVPGTGTVVGGLLKSGEFRLPLTSSYCFYLGPDRGKFIPVIITSIQRQRCHVRTVKPGQAVTCAIKFSIQPDVIEHSQVKDLDWQNVCPSSFKLRRGQVLIEPLSQLPVCYWEFEANLNVIHHSSKLNVAQQGIIQCGSLRQPAKITWVSDAELKTGRQGSVRFRFLNEPEWLAIGKTIIFLGPERMKCVGKIDHLMSSQVSTSR